MVFSYFSNVMYLYQIFVSILEKRFDRCGFSLNSKYFLLTISRCSCETDIGCGIALLSYADMKTLNVNKSILFVHETIDRTIYILITLAIETFSHCSFQQRIQHYIINIVSSNFYFQWRIFKMATFHTKFINEYLKHKCSYAF